MSPVRLGLWALLLLLVLAPPALAGKEAKLGTFDHAGRFITDSQDRVVTLRGFNMVNKLAATATRPTGSGSEGTTRASSPATAST